MTSLLERVITVIAPHHCFVCGIQDNILCDHCADDLFGQAESTCFLCRKPTVEFAVCRQCRKGSTLEHVWVGANYEGVVAKLIKACKFERAAAAALSLGKALAPLLPYLPEETIIVPIPTVNHHVRQRGYDQAVLLSQSLAAVTGYKTKQLLARRSGARQVGANKQQRTAQSAQAFMAIRLEECQGASILLVDDVLTTGATLNAAAKTLKETGATSVNAVTVARTVKLI